MWLLVGIGNPGTKYAATRHNIGFLVVDELGRRTNVSAFREKFGGVIATTQVAHEKAVLLKPMEYMNTSGRAVQKAAAFYQIEPRHIVVVHDEVDLPLGRLRVKEGGGHGGHNGMRSIVECLSTRDVVRVRCGVGRPEGAPGRKMTGHVLGRFGQDELEAAEALTLRAADAVEAIVRNGPLSAMNDYNADNSRALADDKKDKDSSKD